ncbi:hypothetical protein [Methylomagnum sp.]
MAIPHWSFDGFVTYQSISVELPENIQDEIARWLRIEGVNNKEKRENVQWFIKAANRGASGYLSLRGPIFSYPIHGGPSTDYIPIPINSQKSKNNKTSKTNAAFDLSSTEFPSKAKIKENMAEIVRTANELLEALNGLSPIVDHELRTRMSTPKLKLVYGVGLVLDELIYAAGEITALADEMPNHRLENDDWVILIWPLVEAWRAKYGKPPPQSDTGPFVDAVTEILRWLNQEHGAGLPDNGSSIKGWVKDYLNPKVKG